MKRLLAVFCVLITIIGEHGGIATVVTGCENSILTLTCPAGTIIEVTSADYGRHSTTLCPHPDPDTMLNTECSLDETAIMAQKCNALQNCDIVVDNQHSDPCFGTFKYLTVNYFCKHFVPAPEVATEIMSCPHTILSLVCPPTTFIEVTFADYGRHSTTLCPYPDPSAMQNVDCSLNETDIMSQKCNGSQTCNIVVDEGHEIDPCVGTYKYVTVTYICKFIEPQATPLAPMTTPSPAPVTTSSRLGGTRLVTGCENSILTLTCPAGTIIDVISADYGRQSTTVCPHPDPNTMLNTECSLDETALMAQKCNGLQNCDIVVNEQQTDPCFGTFKYLTVNYFCKHFVPAPEVATKIMSCPHTILYLVCPPSTFIEVTFADYGRHSTTLCPYPDLSAMYNVYCSLNETDIMGRKCNGYQKCNIVVDEGHEIDPCVGTYKYVTVTYTCKFREPQTTTPSPAPITISPRLGITTSACRENEECGCDDPCFRHCRQPSSCRNTCAKRCICKERYKRDAPSGLCMKERYCPLSTAQGDTHEVFSECDANCQRFCTNPNPNCSRTPCEPGYVCADNYLRDFTTGRCVLPVDCNSDPKS